MGIFTSNFKFYLPDTEEVVNVDTQINYNLDIVDLNAKRLFEYEVFPGSDIGLAIGDNAIPGWNWYKPYSNSIWGARIPSSIEQDPLASVGEWRALDQFLDTSGAAWAAMPGFEPYFRFTGGAVNKVELVGRIWLGGAAITGGTTINFVNSFPYPPLVGKYFNTYGGNTTSDYAINRINVRNDGKIEMYKYGSGVATSSSENYVDLGGIEFPPDVN